MKMRRKVGKMNSNPKTKTRMIILITLGILFALLPIITVNLSFITGNSDHFTIDKENLKTSGVSEKIHINNNWTAAKAVGICTGNGTYSEPYVIEDLVIDSGESGSCIRIENSDAFFRIENCTTYNSGVHDERITGTFRDWAAGIKISNSTNGMLINNSCSFNYMGIYLLVSINISVSGNNASNNYQGIYLTYVDDYDSLYKYTTRNIITGNTASFNTRYGIRLGGGRYNIVSGNTANNNGDYAAGIYLVNSDNNIISGNTANNNYRTGIDLQHYNNNNTISGNIANNNGIDGIRIYGSFNNTISENTVNGNDNYGIGLAEGDDNIISGNTVNYNEIGINLWNGVGTNYNNTISGNTANYNDYGIALSGCANHLILGNNASFNGNAGIKLGLWKESNNNEIKENIASYNDNGISLGNSNNSTISGNTANNNWLYGIYLEVSLNNMISGNIANANDDGGIVLSESDYNIVSGNTASNNGEYGIYLSSSDDNSIYFNNFINNNRHLFSVNSLNTWNSNGKFIYTYKGDNYTNYLGNYWDNYTGIDENNNGIGDTPFIIDGCIDNYPLMEPIENYQIIEMLEPAGDSGGGIPIELIILISVISGGAVIGVITLLLLIRKRKRID